MMYYLVSYSLSTDSKYVTLNDLEWLLYVKFYFAPVCDVYVYRCEACFQSLAALKLAVNVGEL